eukprot:2695622-Prorocentrum_lima.AAC.1
MAHKLRSILMVDIYECLPTYIVKKCIAYGYQSSIDLATKTMRGIMPTSDLPRMSMAGELQMPVSRVPATLPQLGT